MDILTKITTKHIGVVLFCLFAMNSCYTLQQPIISNTGQLRVYQYVYINHTGSVTGNIPSGGYSYNIYGTNMSYGVYGNNTQTANPSEIIAGYLMKQGYTILPGISPDLAEQTLVVSYGHTGKEMQFFGYSQKIILQFRSAVTHTLIASSEADGYSENDATGITQAIIRALDALFN